MRALLLVATLVLVPTLSAASAAPPRVAPVQTADEQALLLADDLRFAKDLARHKLFALATQVVEQTIKKIEALHDTDLLGEAEFVDATIDLKESENTADDDQVLTGLTAGIERLRDWIRPGSPYAYHPLKVDVLESLAGALRDRGKVHARLGRDGDAAQSKLAADDFAEADKVYEDLYDECTARAEQLKSNEEADAAEAMSLRGNYAYYLRGLNSNEWADVSDDPGFRIEQAIEQLDEFQWEVSDESLAYYESMYQQARAFHKLAVVQRGKGETEDADENDSEAREIIKNALELAREHFWSWVDTAPAAAQVAICGLFSDMWGYLAQLEAESGDLAKGQEWIDTLVKEFDTKKVPLGRRGYRTLLDWAETLDRLGRGALATPIANRIAREGRGTPEGEQAEVLLASLVRGTFIESSDVLMSVARGNVTDGQFADAAFNFERAAALATSDEDRRRFAFDAWNGAGDALTRLKRDVEAAVAFEEALKTAQALELGSDAIASAAYRMYSAFNRRFKDTGDAFDKKQRDAASERLIEMGYEGDLPFLRAEEAFSEVADGDTQGFLAVKSDFEAVSPSSPNYEKAMVYIARCLMGMGKLEEAVTQLATVEARAADPALEPKNADARAKREIAMAQARYYHAELLLRDELKRPAEALAVLAGFEEQITSQDGFFPLVRYLRVKAHAMEGDVEGAEQALQVLVDTGAEASYLSSAAFYAAKALEAKARQVQADGGDPAEAADLLDRAADALWMYCEKSGFASFTNLLTTADWYLEAKNPAEAQRVFQRVIDVFASREPASRIDRARIGLATALDEQHDFGRARPVWKDLLARNPKDPTVRRGAARSFGGWLELGPDDQVTEVAGSGDYADAYQIWVDLQRAANSESKYHDVWWEAKLGTIYTLYRQREIDPKRLSDARELLDNLRLSTPDWDKSTIEYLDPEYRYEQLYWPFFRYLDRQVPATK